MNKTDIAFGRNVHKCRLAMSISQEELAFRAGHHQIYIGMVERGECSISLLNAKKIADALNVKLDYLIGNDDKKRILNENTSYRLARMSMSWRGTEYC